MHPWRPSGPTSQLPGSGRPEMIAQRQVAVALPATHASLPSKNRRALQKTLKPKCDRNSPSPESRERVRRSRAGLKGHPKVNQPLRE